MIVGNYGVRTYQVSDIGEKHSFLIIKSIVGLPVSL